MVEYQHVTADMSVYRDGTIKLHGPEGFAGMRAAGTASAKNGVVPKADLPSSPRTSGGIVR